jgi:nitrogen fixation protein NifQ
MGKADFIKGDVAPARRDEYDDIVKLLLEHRSGLGFATEEVAYWVAASCLGDNHLWQDMKLESRKELSELLAFHFHPLFEKNTGDMKWKKFFYKQICEREGFMLCKSPSCGVCVDYPRCFGPED